MNQLSGSLRGVHDPSTPLFCGGAWRLYCTGNGLYSRWSSDLREWHAGPKAFPQPAGWWREAVPKNNGHVWAPELIQLNGVYHLYYAVSSFGVNGSAIGLAVSPTLDPDDPAFGWRDAGPVIHSVEDVDDFNAIDPSVMLDDSGRLWMAFGSFWSGIQLVELDPQTGKLLHGGADRCVIASRQTQPNTIEASRLLRANGFYYLFFAWDYCCRGVNSTYNIRMGRAERIEGPYFDRDGRPLLEGGGTLVLGTEAARIGPGAPAFLRDGEDVHLVFHYYDATQNGMFTMGLLPIEWDAAAWPRVAWPRQS